MSRIVRQALPWDLDARADAEEQGVSKPTRGRCGPWLCLLGLHISLGCTGSGRDALWARPQGQSDAGTASDAACEPSAPELPSPAPEPLLDPAHAADVHRYFQISVQDQDGAAVVGATLRTVNHIVLSSDANGKVAFYEPDLMGLDVFFFVERAGYDLAADGFGYRGKALKVEEGGAGVIMLQRGDSPPVLAASDLQTRLLAGNVPSGARCFTLYVRDQATKRGVPLVFLRSEGETLISDSQGIAAYCDPDQLGKRVRFAVTSHGYSFPAGEVELAVEAGERAVLELTRLNLAERLYRSTGQGIYRDSQLLGLTRPEGLETLRGLVMMQDAVSTAVHRGKLFWLWGNTDRPGHPLGNFFGSGATTELSANVDPALSVSFDYLLGNTGNAKAMGQALAPSNLPSWLGSLVSLPDQAGQDQLFAVYAKPRSDLSLAARGLARLDAQQTFQAVGVDYPSADFVGPRGQPMRVQHGAEEYVYFTPPLRLKARAESLLDPKHYEVFSAFGEARSSSLQREGDARLSYAFRNDARATSAEAVSAAGLPKSQSLEGHLADAQTGAALKQAGEGGQAFSPWRGRFVRVFQQLGGISSFAGEVWYAEADTPLGPWVYAQKLVTHDRYTFYTPWIHTSFEQGQARFLYFEGSYTTALAGDDVTATPRYERNQIMYRLDLDDTRLRLPVAVYDVSEAGHGDYATLTALPAQGPARAAAFFAPEARAAGTLPLHWSAPACASSRRLLLGEDVPSPALFHAFAPDAPERPAQLVPLYEFSDESGAHAYGMETDLAGFTRAVMPLAYVWPSPIDVKLPLGDYAARVQAQAGDDQCLREQGAGRGARVRLDGSGSASLDGKIAHFAWYLDRETCPFATQPSAELRVGPGVHSVVLEVRDEAGNSARDSLLLEVSE
jgi:hypothetical protein